MTTPTSSQNSTMSLSGKRYLYHCSLRSEKNQRTWAKFITLMKKVCCQLSSFSKHGRIAESHVLKVEELSRRKMTEDQNTIMELRARIQELQNEVNCRNDLRDFKDAEPVRSGPSHVPALLPSYRDPGGLPSRNNQPPDIWNSQSISEECQAILYECRAAEKGRQAFGTHMENRETFFCKSTSVFFSSLSARVKSKIRSKNWGMYLFTISYGSYAMDQRSTDG